MLVICFQKRIETCILSFIFLQNIEYLPTWINPEPASLYILLFGSTAQRDCFAVYIDTKLQFVMQCLSSMMVPMENIIYLKHWIWQLVIIKNEVFQENRGTVWIRQQLKFLQGTRNNSKCYDNKEKRQKKVNLK